MYVIPVSWIPWVLVFVGLARLFGLINDIDVTAGIVILVIGGIWLYLRYSGKSKSSTETSPEETSTENNN